jgi:hypothetical protein
MGDGCGLDVVEVKTSPFQLAPHKTQEAQLGGEMNQRILFVFVFVYWSLLHRGARLQNTGTAPFSILTRKESKEITRTTTTSYRHVSASIGDDEAGGSDVCDLGKACQEHQHHNLMHEAEALVPLYAF